MPFLVPILLISASLIALSAFSIFLWQIRLLKNGTIVREEGYNGPARVEATVNAIVRYMFRRSIHFRKFLLQYLFHIFVRVTYYVDVWTSYLYAKSRNMFVKNAVRNRGTVPHFWQHLKVYKQEMDKEKEQSEKESEE